MLSLSRLFILTVSYLYALASFTAFAVELTAAQQIALKNEVAELSTLEIVPTHFEATASTIYPDTWEVIIGSYLFYIEKEGMVMYTDVLQSEAATTWDAVKINQIRANALNTLKEENMLIFNPEKIEHTLTVFADIDCHHTARFHLEINELLTKGIRVRYLFFPETDLNSNHHQRTIAVWCADNPHVAFTDELIGIKVSDEKTNSCEHPLEKHFTLAQSLGIAQGTPTLIFDDGYVHVGYLSVKEILEHWGM